MKYPKIALKGGPTLERGIKIVNKLISLGASNLYNAKGYGSGYYFIDFYGNIDREKYLPKDYTLVQLEQKLFKLI